MGYKTVVGGAEQNSGNVLDLRLYGKYIRRMLNGIFNCFRPVLVTLSLLALALLVYMTGGVIVLGMFVVCLICLLTGTSDAVDEQDEKMSWQYAFIGAMITSFLYVTYRSDVRVICAGLQVPESLKCVLPYTAAAVYAVILIPAFWYVGNRLSYAVRPSIQKWIDSGYSYGIAVGVSIMSIMSMIAACMNESIWLDEAYTIGFVTPGWKEMFQLLALDVHPPLYYVIVKTVVLMGQSVNSEFPLIMLAKLTSVIPFVFLLIVGLTVVRYRWGRYVSGIFILAVTGVPSLMSLGCDMRMYSWALLFVTITYLSALFVVERKSFVMWGLFVVWALCAAYTHYFAVVAVMPAFLYVLRLEHRGIASWVIACLVVVCAYLPWLTVFLHQLQVVRENYWILPIDVPQVIMFLRAVIEGVFGCVIIVLLFRMIRWERLSLMAFCGALRMAMVSVGLPFFVIGVGVFVSIVIRPVFGVRYMLPSLGMLWLGIAILSKRQRINAQMMIVPVFLVMLAFSGMFVMLKEEYAQYKRNLDFIAFVEKMDRPFFIGRDLHRSAAATVMSNASAALWKWDFKTDPLLQEVFDISFVNNADEIKELLNSGHDIIYLSTSEQEIKSFAEETGLSCVYEGFYLVSWDTYVYRVSL